MALNYTKCVLVPLWQLECVEFGERHLRRWLRKRAGAWADMDIKTSATYLGLLIGPDAIDEALWGPSWIRLVARVAALGGRAGSA